MHSVKKEAYSLPSEFRSPAELSGLPADSSILVGFSGGADSTALLHLLSNYAKETGAKIYAAHVNHSIRGDEADRDELFCKTFASDLNIEFFSQKFDVPSIAKETGESIETAARNVRYEYFDLLMKTHGIPLLATAHNADDNLETVIFNICRGSGLSGMCGIPSTRTCEYGTVIRPILGMEKRDIIKYCQKNGLAFVTDSTNADTDYTRNKIRNDIIPILRQINSAAVKNAYRMTENLRADSVCLEGMANAFLNEAENNFSIPLPKLCGVSSSVANRALMNLYSTIANGRTLETTHIEALKALSQKGIPHSAISLPEKIEGVIENGALCLRKKEDKPVVVEDYRIQLCNKENVILQTNAKIFIGNSHNEENVYKNSILLSIDFDKIEGELIARNRCTGDKIRMGGMNKSLKKLMCDKKIPLDIRARLPIICDSNGVLAVPFIGIRDGAKYNDNSKQKLNIYFYLH